MRPEPAGLTLGISLLWFSGQSVQAFAALPVLGLLGVKPAVDHRSEDRPYASG